MSTLVKICGLMKPETVAAIRHLPIDYMGFVFATSRRQVLPQQAAELMRELEHAPPHRRPRAVGVFVNPTLEQLRDVLDVVPLDVVQLHGDESPEYCRQVKEMFGVQVWKVLPVQWQSAAESEMPTLRLPDAYAGSIDGLMLDTYDAQAVGGTGRTFRWSVIPQYRVWSEQAGIPLLVAGGLHAGNVAELLSTYQPHGVDVSSGVETDGVKDIAKITEFVERVKFHGNNDA